MNRQALEILKDEIKVQEEMGNNYFISVLKFLIEKMEALGDGGGLFIIPGKTYYIGDNKTPAVALFPRFQYSNGTIDTIHHTNIREAPTSTKQ